MSKKSCKKHEWVTQTYRLGDDIVTETMCSLCKKVRRLDKEPMTKSTCNLCDQEHVREGLVWEGCIKHLVSQVKMLREQVSQLKEDKTGEE